MVRMEYEGPPQNIDTGHTIVQIRVEWFRSRTDAMKRVETEGLSEDQYKIRWIGFRFTPTEGNTDGYSDPDGNIIRGEEGAILHWLNRFAV